MKIFKTTLWASVGLFGLAALVAMPAAADQQILDDLIVDGSACIGQDCVNGESFGFDTIRVKENNLRIKFDDTSTSASFPRNDWQLTANESSNGGQEKFSIDDITGGRTPFTIEASAPSHSLYVDDGGRLGFGTSTPVADLHVKTGNTPTLRLEQDGSSGFTAQTWDVAGNEANFFIRDATNGSTLPFRLQPGHPSNGIYMASTGNVGFGTTSPDDQIDVERSANVTTRIKVQNTNGSAPNTGFEMENANSAGALYRMEVDSSGNFLITQGATGGSEYQLFQGVTGNGTKHLFADGPTDLMLIEADGDVRNATGVFASISDRNVKTDVLPIDPGTVLAKVAELPISTWRFKHQEDARHMGPMAQDFFAAFGLSESDTSIALNDLSGVALAAIQGLNEELTVKERRIAELEARLARMEAALGLDQ